MTCLLRTGTTLPDYPLHQIEELAHTLMRFTRYTCVFCDQKIHTAKETFHLADLPNRFFPLLDNDTHSLIGNKYRDHMREYETP